MATDPVEPIHDYNMPILPFKRPPGREDFVQPRKRERRPPEREQPHQTPSRQDGHIDDYA